MQKLFENFRGWVNERDTTPEKQQAQTKKMQLAFGKDAQCSYYEPQMMAKIGFPGDLHSFHLTLPIKNEEGTIAWIGRAYDKQGNSRFYGAAPKSGGMTSGAAQLIKFENGLMLPVGANLKQALEKIISKVGLSLDKVEIPSDASTIPAKFASFSAEIASGKRPVNYCKGPGKAAKAAPQKKVETDDICNQKLVLNVQKKFSKRLPGVQLKHADDKIIISICKIQRMLNNLGLNIEVDGIIGPQTVRALQIAYAELKPTGNKGEKS